MAEFVIDRPAGFARTISIARKFTSDDGARPGLCCVLFENGRVIGTDSYVFVTLSWPYEGHDPFLIDRDDVKRIARLAVQYGGDLGAKTVLTIDDGVGTFRVGARSYVFPLVERSHFPKAEDVERILTLTPKRDIPNQVCPLHLNPGYLAKFACLDDGPVQWSMPDDPTKPLRLDHLTTEAIALIMPVRLK